MMKLFEDFLKYKSSKEQSDSVKLLFIINPPQAQFKTEVPVLKLYNKSVTETGDWALHEWSGPSTMVLSGLLSGCVHKVRGLCQSGKTPNLH